MKPFPYMPGVPAAGHISRGYWHPGRIDGCAKCPKEGNRMIDHSRCIPADWVTSAHTHPGQLGRHQFAADIGTARHREDAAQSWLVIHGYARDEAGKVLERARQAPVLLFGDLIQLTWHPDLGGGSYHFKDTAPASGTT